ncbi:unnamed protein product [Echinostoma caproni]|uniref:DHC_N2 domain-containing protein n=1 Tax=Echinostoma caproni TaxID=27848 RepID=A0A183AAQ0_9TREM|nr:unnamed protein product [Echinostoma caproni]
MEQENMVNILLNPWYPSLDTDMNWFISRNVWLTEVYHLQEAMQKMFTELGELLTTDEEFEVAIMKSADFLDRLHQGETIQCFPLSSTWTDTPRIFGIECSPLKDFLFAKLTDALSQCVSQFVAVFIKQEETTVAELTHMITVNDLKGYAQMAKSLIVAKQNEQRIAVEVKNIRIRYEAICRMAIRLSNRTMLDSLWPSSTLSRPSLWRQFTSALHDAENQFKDTFEENWLRIEFQLQDQLIRVQDLSNSLTSDQFANSSEKAANILEMMQEPIQEMTRLEVSVHQLLNQRKSVRDCATVYALPISVTAELAMEQIKSSTSPAILRQLDNAIRELNQLDTHMRRAAVRYEAWRLMLSIDEGETFIRQQTLSTIDLASLRGKYQGWLETSDRLDKNDLIVGVCKIRLEHLESLFPALIALTDQDLMENHSDYWRQIQTELGLSWSQCWADCTLATVLQSDLEKHVSPIMAIRELARHARVHQQELENLKRAWESEKVRLVLCAMTDDDDEGFALRRSFHPSSSKSPDANCRSVEPTTTSQPNEARTQGGTPRRLWIVANGTHLQIWAENIASRYRALILSDSKLHDLAEQDGKSFEKFYPLKRTDRFRRLFKQFLRLQDRCLFINSLCASSSRPNSKQSEEPVQDHVLELHQWITEHLIQSEKHMTSRETEDRPSVALSLETFVSRLGRQWDRFKQWTERMDCAIRQSDAALEQALNIYPGLAMLHPDELIHVLGHWTVPFTDYCTNPGKHNRLFISTDGVFAPSDYVEHVSWQRGNPTEQRLHIRMHWLHTDVLRRFAHHVKLVFPVVRQLRLQWISNPGCWEASLINDPVPHLASFVWLQMIKHKLIRSTEAEQIQDVRLVARQFYHDHPFGWYTADWMGYDQRSGYVIPPVPNSRELLLLGTALIDFKVSRQSGTQMPDARNDAPLGLIEFIIRSMTRIRMDLNLCDRRDIPDSASPRHVRNSEVSSQWILGREMVVQPGFGLVTTMRLSDYRELPETVRGGLQSVDTMQREEDQLAESVIVESLADAWFGSIEPGLITGCNQDDSVAGGQLTREDCLASFAVILPAATATNIQRATRVIVPRTSWAFVGRVVAELKLKHLAIIPGQIEKIIELWQAVQLDKPILLIGSIATGKSTLWTTLVNVLNQKSIVRANPLLTARNSRSSFHRLSTTFRQSTWTVEQHNGQDIPSEVYDHLALSSLIDEGMTDELPGLPYETVIVEQYFPLAFNDQRLPDWAHTVGGEQDQLWRWIVLDTAEHSTTRCTSLQETLLGDWINENPKCTVLWEKTHLTDLTPGLVHRFTVCSIHDSDDADVNKQLSWVHVWRSWCQTVPQRYMLNVSDWNEIADEMESMLRDGMTMCSQTPSLGMTQRDERKPGIVSAAAAQRCVQTVIALATSCFEQFLPRHVWELREIGRAPPRRYKHVVERINYYWPQIRKLGDRPKLQRDLVCSFLAFAFVWGVGGSLCGDPPLRHKFSACFFRRLTTFASFLGYFDTSVLESTDRTKIQTSLAAYYPVDDSGSGEWLTPNTELDSEYWLPNLFHYIVDPREARLVPFWHGIDKFTDRWPEEYMRVIRTSDELPRSVPFLLPTPFHVSSWLNNY